MIDLSHLYQDYINAGGKVRQFEFFEEVVQGIIQAGYSISSAKSQLLVCNKCGSDNLKLVTKGPHESLVCGDCVAYQRHMKKSEADTFRKLRGIE